MISSGCAVYATPPPWASPARTFLWPLQSSASRKSRRLAASARRTLSAATRTSRRWRSSSPCSTPAEEGHGLKKSPVVKPCVRGSMKGDPPTAASRTRSLKEPMPVPARFICTDMTPRWPFATSPNSQPSPYMSTRGPSTPCSWTVSASRAALQRCAHRRGRCPIRSNLKPSTRYSTAQCTTLSTTKRSIMCLSAAVLFMQVEFSYSPFSARRW
mmetsp:Transcript_163/g.355  ORF Transcript_163/g.355 Transcript_163/m.355 type:complete len:214 (-) Transcript_163:833-1474(-)